MDEIERGALPGEQSARRAAQGAEGLIGIDGIAVAYLPVDLNARIELREYGIEPRTAAHDRCFATDDRGQCRRLLRNQLSGDVAAAHILGERDHHDGVQVGGVDERGVVHAV